MSLTNVLIPILCFYSIKKMIAAHKAHKSFGWGSFLWVDSGATAVATYLRSYSEERLLILNNLSDQVQPIQLPFDLPSTAWDLLNNQQIDPEMNSLNPYQFLWIKL